jgi:hypothetical protein
MQSTLESATRGLSELSFMKLRWWCLGSVLFALLIVGGCSAYLRLGTTVIGDFVSPDGVQDAVLMVRNGGAMTGYATGISLVHRNPLARQFALIRGPNVFVVDDNDGAVPWGDRGQLNVKVSWLSNTQLLVQYSVKAGVLRQDTSYRSTTIRYALVP